MSQHPSAHLCWMHRSNCNLSESAQSHRSIQIQLPNSGCHWLCYYLLRPITQVTAGLNSIRSPLGVRPSFPLSALLTVCWINTTLFRQQEPVWKQTPSFWWPTLSTVRWWYTTWKQCALYIVKDGHSSLLNVIKLHYIKTSFWGAKSSISLRITISLMHQSVKTISLFKTTVSQAKLTERHILIRYYVILREQVFHLNTKNVKSVIYCWSVHTI